MTKEDDLAEEVRVHDRVRPYSRCSSHLHSLLLRFVARLSRARARAHQDSEGAWFGECCVMMQAWDRGSWPWTKTAGGWMNLWFWCDVFCTWIQGKVFSKSTERVSWFMLSSRFNLTNLTCSGEASFNRSLISLASWWDMLDLNRSYACLQGLLFQDYFFTPLESLEHVSNKPERERDLENGWESFHDLILWFGLAWGLLYVTVSCVMCNFSPTQGSKAETNTNNSVGMLEFFQWFSQFSLQQ